VSGDVVTITGHAAPRARIRAILQVQVTEARAATKGRGRQRTHAVRMYVRYRVAMEGVVDAHGQFTGRLPVTYRPTSTTSALVTVTARTPSGAVTRTVGVIIQPRWARRA